MTALRAILAKDLRIELRTLQSLPAMALFAITTFVIFRFGLDRTSLEGSLAAGVVLVTILFAALLAINRLFVAERDEGGFDAIRLAPVDGAALFGAKVGALFVYLAALEAIALPVFGIFFLDSGAGLVPLLIAAAGAAEPLLATGGPEYDGVAKWVVTLGLYDLVFLLVGYAVYDFLLED